MSRDSNRISNNPRSSGLAAAWRILQAAIFWVGVMTATTANAQQEAWRTELGGFVDGVVTTVLDQDAVAGAVVIIVTGDDTLLSRGYRLSDARTGRLMSPEEDVLPLASVTKVFTALVILQLVAEGSIALDDPIARHLPALDLNQRFGDITIRHLLSHTAGLEERYSGYFAAHPALADAPRTAQISAILPRQIRPPTDVISYSNASYVLLGAVVAQVAGEPFEDYLAEQILFPLGIESAHFMHLPTRPGTPNPFHVWDAGRYVAIDPLPFPAVHTSSGGLALTSNDMGRILRMLLRQGAVDGRSVLPAETVARMQEPVWPNRPEFAGRTLGYWTEAWAGHAVYYHGGTHFGFHTNMALIPSLDLGFFVAANGPSGSALTGLPRRVMREVIAPHERPLVVRADCDTTCLSSYSGRFITTRRNEAGLDRLHARAARIIEVGATEDGMLLVSGLGYARRFVAIEADLFQTPQGDMRLGFRRDAAGRVSVAYLNGGIHSFDRLRFWQSATSLHSGLAVALIGALLCLAGAGAVWRTERRVKGTPLRLGLTWLGLCVATIAALDPVLSGRDLSAQAMPSAAQWAVTGLYGFAVITLIWAGMWLIKARDTSGQARAPLLVLAALPMFVWALFAAWMWNLPTAALTW